MRSRTKAIASRVAVTIALAAIATTVMGTSAAVADDKSGGVGITVSVTAAPGSGVTASTMASPGEVGGPAITSSSGASTVATPSQSSTSAAPAAGEFDLGGVLFVSGVVSDYDWSINPLEGVVHAQFTVHNVSSEIIDSTANFTVIGPFGNEIGRVDNVAIAQLKPDESRAVDASVTGLGQWSFFTIHATLVPPSTVQGTALTPVTREGFIFVLPWFVLVLLIFGIGAYSVVRIVRDAEFGVAPVVDTAAPAGGAA